MVSPGAAYPPTSEVFSTEGVVSVTTASSTSLLGLGSGMSEFVIRLMLVMDSPRRFVSTLTVIQSVSDWPTSMSPSVQTPVPSL